MAQNPKLYLLHRKYKMTVYFDGLLLCNFLFNIVILNFVMTKILLSSFVFLIQTQNNKSTRKLAKYIATNLVTEI